MKNPFVFVVGCPRSGTTLLARMISAHPEIALVPEIRWLAQRYSSREGLTPDGKLTPAFFAQLRNLGRFSRIPLEPAELAELAANHASLSYADFMTLLFDAYGKKRGKRLVGQKNADHAVPMDLDTLHTLWPDAKFVHLIRDGRDVCLSVMNWRVQDAVARLFTTWDAHRVSTIAAWWEWQVRLMREAGMRIGASQYKEIHYDTLIASPEQTCVELCEFMGVAYDSAMQRFHENPPERARGAKQPWLPPTPGRRNWRSEMSSEDVARFEAVAGDLLEQLGHTRGRAALPSTDSTAAALVRDAFGLRPLPEHWLQSRAEPGQRSLELASVVVGKRAAKPATKSALGRLWPYVRRQRGQLAVVFIATWVSSLFDLALPYVTGIMLIDHVVRHRRLDELPRVVGALVGIFVGQKIADFVADYVETRVSQRLVHGLRCELFEHVQTLPVSFFDRRQTGEILQRVTGDIDTIDVLLTNVLPSLGAQLVTLVGAVVLLYVSCQSLTFFVLPTVVLLAVSVVAFKGPVRGFARRARDAMGHMSGHATEAVAGIRMVKAFSAEGIEAKRFEGDSRQVLLARLRSVVPQALFTTTVDACVLVGTLLVVYFGTRRILAGTLTVGALVTALGYLTRIYNEAKKASRMNIPIQRVLVAAERIFELMDLPAERGAGPREASEGARIGAHGPGPVRITFENVCFSYDPDREVIRDMNLEVAAGEVVAFVGQSGGGKTTLVNLLLRFYEPAAGQLRFDGVPINEIPLEELRARIGVVSQDTFLFSGTLRENIAYGKPGATPAEIEGAARAAFAHDFIVKMPSGYDSVVGERGVTLSGGQRQRVAIARALLREPSLLVFDEATSNLDADSERYVQEAIRTIARGRTVLVIAHRLSTIAWVDRIVVLEDGSIAEMGTHEALLGRNGIYSRLSKMQLDLRQTG